MSAENNYIYDEFKITPLSGGANSIDLSDNSIASLSYYEDILSPTVTAKLNFAVVDVSNAPGGFDIFGGEEVNFQVNVPGCTSKLNFSKTGKGLFVRRVSADKSSTTAIFSTELVSKETFANETVRVSNRFDTTISDSVNRIFSTLKSSKTINVEKTVNKYSFIGNTKRPFDLITWLCPKSVPPGDGGFGTAGYLFYETLDGYFYKSVNTLITADSVFTYTQTEAAESYDENNRFRILSSNISKNNDILNSLRLGMYANTSLFYNLYKNEATKVEYKLSEKYSKNLKTSAGTSQYPKLPSGIENFPSRYLLRTLDVGNLTDAGKIEETSNLPKYQAEAVVRYNLLFSQILNITIPCNLDLRAGQVITCRIPESTANPLNKSYESQHTGNYMISNLCHTFEGNQCFTYLSLVRDSYEIKTNIN